MSRLRAVNDLPERADGRYVLYWMTSARRTRWNFALDRALERARALGKPLWVLEALRCDYPHASDRLHRFVLDGMRANAAAFARAGVRYHPYVEPHAGAGRGLVARLARDACLVVADDSPASFFPRMLAAAGATVAVRLEAVDGNGLLPLSASGRAWPTAYSFRRHLQRTLPLHLTSAPSPDPLRRLRLPPAPALPREVRARWPAAPAALLRAGPTALAALPIDHTVAPTGESGGEPAARRALARFLEHGLPHYGEARNHPDSPATSGLSPWLHFGHLAAHEVAAAVLAREGRALEDLIAGGSGGRSGWWGLSAAAEAFLDQLVTWRELGFAFAHHRPENFDRYASLPAWAQATLARHAGDPRPYVASRARLEAAATHDEVWNAAQRELLRTGRMHGYLRMLWGKKVLEWSRGPEAAWATLVHLNDRYALDGRDPNSYSGIGWTFGRFDRPWYPERPIFGVVRFMSSASTRRKLRLTEYLRRFGPPGAAAARPG